MNGRFLDFLIYKLIRAVLLHRSGVPFMVSSPERYAVHKLIIASRRLSDANGAAKREKDVHQASLLIEALQETRRQDDLAHVFAEAWGRGHVWREGIGKGLGLMSAKKEQAVEEKLRRALSEIGEKLEGFSAASWHEPSGATSRILVIDSVV